MRIEGIQVNNLGCSDSRCAKLAEDTGVDAEVVGFLLCEPRVVGAVVHHHAVDRGGYAGCRPLDPLTTSSKRGDERGLEGR